MQDVLNCCTLGYFGASMLTCLIFFSCSLDRILRACPWYEELDPVMRDRPMARPMYYQDNMGLSNKDKGHGLPRDLGLTNNLNSQTHVLEPSEAISGSPLFDLRPNDNDNIGALDPLLRSFNASPLTTPLDLQDDVEHSITDPLIDTSTSPSFDILPSGSRRRSSTPSISKSSKRQLLASKVDRKPASLVADSPDHGSSRDIFGLKSMMGQLPTKEEHAEAKKNAAMTQERMTSRITEAMSNIISLNRAMDLASKREMALDELQSQTRIARSAIVVDLIKSGQTPEQARIIAHEELPDL